MAFLRLTGPGRLRARIAMIVIPDVLLFSYNQSNIGGVLRYPSFIKHFPSIDIVNTKGSTKITNAKVQGAYIDHIYSASLRKWHQLVNNLQAQLLQSTRSVVF
jgi:hypothetical protein